MVLYKIVFVLILCNFKFAFGDIYEDLFDRPIFVSKDESGDNILNLNFSQIAQAAMFAQMLEKESFERNQALGKQFSLNDFTPGRMRFVGRTLPENLIIQHYRSKIFSRTIKILLETLCKRCSRDEKIDFIRKIVRERYILGGICEPNFEPDPQLLSNPFVRNYRRTDGTYNNLFTPNIGQPLTPMPRLLPADYCDFVAEPRCAKSGKPLPNPRILSLCAHFQRNIFDKRLNMVASEITQVISHDLSFQLNDNDVEKNIACCTPDHTDVLDEKFQHSSCIPIEVDRKRDPFYKTFDIGCLHLIRSISAPSSRCFLGPRQQISTVPGGLDLSLIYGWGNNALSLRTLEGGKLRANEKGHMPPACGQNIATYCYASGDVRTNQHAQLASLQIVYLKNHNQICDALQEMHPSWDDERLYQEARRINIAQWQHIVYRELLPLLIGKSRAKDMFSSMDKNGYTTCYSKNINGATYNDFSVAFRVLHSTTPNGIQFCNEARKVISQQLFRHALLNVSILEATTHGQDDCLRGMMHSKMPKFDNHISEEISTQMLPGRNIPYGTDLESIDIQRSREHGVAGLNAYRKFCGLRPFRSFEDMYDSMDRDKADLLSQLYEDVDDVDLTVGGMMENPVHDSIFGPTITCIFEHQFRNTMCGDRFFYTNIKQDYTFTRSQLEEISKTTMSMLFCQTSGIQKITPNAFLVESSSNPLVSCDKIQKMSFAPWKTRSSG